MKLNHLSFSIYILVPLLWASAANAQDLFEQIFPNPSECTLTGTIYFDEETKKVENNLQDGLDHSSPFWAYKGPVEVTELGVNSFGAKIAQTGSFFGASYQAVIIPFGRGTGDSYDYKLFFDKSPEQVQAQIRNGSGIQLNIFKEGSKNSRPQDDANVGFLQRTKDNKTVYICFSVGDF